MLKVQWIVLSFSIEESNIMHCLRAVLLSDNTRIDAQNVEDNHEEAARVAPQTLRLCQLVSVSSVT